jgi:hypothetical protein
MACLIAPATLGILTTVCRNKVPKQWHINWLNTMIFGAVIALGVDHIASGEIVPWPPFLTAMANPTATAAMFGEILSVGIPMTIALVAVWAAIVVVYEKMVIAERKPAKISES